MWSTADQLAWFQLVTWNDYEEATEIETGIDNCVTVAAAVSGKALLEQRITSEELRPFLQDASYLASMSATAKL